MKYNKKHEFSLKNMLIPWTNSFNLGEIVKHNFYLLLKLRSSTIKKWQKLSQFGFTFGHNSGTHSCPETEKVYKELFPSGELYRGMHAKNLRGEIKEPNWHCRSTNDIKMVGRSLKWSISNRKIGRPDHKGEKEVTWYEQKIVKKTFSKPKKFFFRSNNVSKVTFFVSYAFHELWATLV